MVWAGSLPGMDQWEAPGLPKRRSLVNDPALGVAPVADEGALPTGRWRLSLHPFAGTVVIGLVVVLVTIGMLRIAAPGSERAAASAAAASSTADIVTLAEGGQSGEEQDADVGLSVTGGAGDAGANGLMLAVYVTGAVNEPGIVEVPDGSRLSAAVDAAGGLGAAADPLSINLARLVQDGEHVHVFEVGEDRREVQGGVTQGGPGAEPGGMVGTGAPACIDLNTATAAQLETLDGVGPKIAARILERRDAQGSFSANDELLAIPGIGPVLLSRITEGLCP